MLTSKGDFLRVLWNFKVHKYYSDQGWNVPTGSNFNCISKVVLFSTLLTGSCLEHWIEKDSELSAEFREMCIVINLWCLQHQWETIYHVFVPPNSNPLAHSVCDSFSCLPSKPPINPQMSLGNSHLLLFYTFSDGARLCIGKVVYRVVNLLRIGFGHLLVE